MFSDFLFEPVEAGQRWKLYLFICVLVCVLVVKERVFLTQCLRAHFAPYPIVKKLYGFSNPVSIAPVDIH